MYPFEPLRPAWATLWTSVRRSAPYLPDELTWDDDVHALWAQPELALSQSCGWPLVTSEAQRLRVVGVFDPRVPAAGQGWYRSSIVVRTGDVPRWSTPGATAGARAAVNNLDSLSGWISLSMAVHGRPGIWHGDVVETGGHVHSLAALRRGDADVAAIDALSFALLRDIDREHVEGLSVIGRGPRIPCVPIVVPYGADESLVVSVQAALADACLDPLTARARRRLRIRRFVPLGPEAYSEVASWAATA